MPMTGGTSSVSQSKRVDLGPRFELVGLPSNDGKLLWQVFDHHLAKPVVESTNFHVAKLACDWRNE